MPRQAVGKRRLHQADYVTCAKPTMGMQVIRNKKINALKSIRTIKKVEPPIK